MGGGVALPPSREKVVPFTSFLSRKGRGCRLINGSGNNHPGNPKIYQYI
jgi:hypothetical protein